eukprot:CAMPEP_0182900188 /NCGR_PEP_ID=MMETSP0034_2-20130328/28652_1 /TAXON_ID=156128 /ORGANISM="Nephroselmis pyriformis, Strain CCMP717" /LENGTH=119 /DNA_ID=CAMNT_0025034359 /DNA_START=24 /DNA_END=380 /DNA_ORIENTATION=+
MSAIAMNMTATVAGARGVSASTARKVATQAAAARTTSAKFGSKMSIAARPLVAKAAVASRKAAASVTCMAAPLVGAPAPEFDAPAVYDQEFADIKLSDYKGKKYVVLFFYPLDFTFVCP